MPTAEKESSLIEKGKAFQRAVEYNQFLRKIIAAYSSPFIEPKYDYTELNALRKTEAQERLDTRFLNDKKDIAAAILSSAGNPELSILCSKDTLSELDQLLINVLSLLLEIPETRKNVIPASVKEFLVGRSSSKNENADSTDRASFAKAVLNVVIDPEIIPRQFEFDYLDDIEHIIKSRYAGYEDKHWDRSNLIFNLLNLIVDGQISNETQNLPAKLHLILGANHGFVPKTGTTHPDVKKGIPDLFDDLISVKARDNLPRFLEINKEYSVRQRTYHKVHSKGNPWGLPLMAGLEEDHHLMLRTLIKLKKAGKLTKDDEVLIVGPRYVDELTFFRKQLGFPKTVGLDLFEDKEEGIVAGDMHSTEFSNGQFGLIFCAGTLAYSYDFRKVIKEFARILKRPGFLCLMDAGERVNGVDPLGRSDPMGLESMINCFYQHKLKVHAQDKGRTPFPSSFKWWPCVVLELED